MNHPLPSRHCMLIVWASFVGALTLTMMPLPEGASPFRPEWTVLVLIYWCLALPNRIGLGTAWIVGLLVDVAKGTLLGQHALGFAMVAYIALQLHQRIRVHPLWQQAVTVWLLLALNQLLVQWIHGMMGRPLTDWVHWAPTLAGALLWPAVFLLLRHTRRRFRIA